MTAPASELIFINEDDENVKNNIRKIGPAHRSTIAMARCLDEYVTVGREGDKLSQEGREDSDALVN